MKGFLFLTKVFCWAMSTTCDDLQYENTRVSKVIVLGEYLGIQRIIGERLPQDCVTKYGEI